MISYKLRLGMIAVDRSTEGETRIISIPPEALVELPGGALPAGLVDAFWNGKSVSVFAQDLLDRGELVLRASA